LIWIAEPTKVFITRAGQHELTTTVLSEDQIRDLVEKMVNRHELPGPFGAAPLR
jgi:pilus assembly protein CpaF